MKKLILILITTATLLRAQEEEAPRPKMIILGANLLARAYDQNPIAADARYRDRRCLVVGTIDDIGRGIDGDPYVVIGSRSFENVQCIFSVDHEAEIAELQKGQAIAVVGNVEGKVLFNVLLTDCHFADIPPPPVPVRKAIAVTKE